MVPAGGRHSHSQSTVPPTCVLFFFAISRSRVATPGRKEAHVDTPSDAREAGDEVPALDAPDESKVDEADEWPEAPAGDDDGEELAADAGEDGVPVDAGVVDGRPRKQVGGRLGRVGPLVRPAHGFLQAAHEEGEEEGVDDGADGLVEERLGQGVLDVELAFAVGRRLARLGLGSVLLRRLVVGGEALFEVVLPVGGGVVFCLVLWYSDKIVRAKRRAAKMFAPRTMGTIMDRDIIPDVVIWRIDEGPDGELNNGHPVQDERFLIQVLAFQ